MKKFPLTFETVQHGNATAREVANRDELIALRSELELLVLNRAGQSRLACIALSNSGAFDDPKTPEEFHSILVDALHPRVAKTIEAIDRDFPDIIGEVCRDVIAEEAASFQKDVAACLEKSTSSRVKQLSKSYALSVGLTPPNQDEVAEPLDESEINMTEQSNVPNPANEDEFSDEFSASLPTESADDQDAHPFAQDSTDDFEVVSADGFDDVEEALSAMEFDLQELQAMANGDVDAPAVEVANVESAATETMVEETFDTDALAESTLEAATHAEFGGEFEGGAPEVEPAPMDAAASATANSDVIEEMFAQDETASPNLDATEVTAGNAGFDADTTPEASLPESDDLDATFEEPEAAIEADGQIEADNQIETDDLDEAGLAASLVAFNEAIAEINDEAPVRNGENQVERQPFENQAATDSHRPAQSPRPVRTPHAQTPPAQIPTASDRPASQPSSPSRRPVTHRSPSPRPRTSDVEMSIGNFADFLLNEVNGMWSEARQGLDEICTVRDEIQAIRAEVSRIHQEISTMRDSVLSARHDIRSVQAQIQNQRDDANRARQRADSAALDAQSACDRAAAAAREAESMATLSQPR